MDMDIMNWWTKGATVIPSQRAFYFFHSKWYQQSRDYKSCAGSEKKTKHNAYYKIKMFACQAQPKFMEPWKKLRDGPTSF